MTQTKVEAPFVEGGGGHSFKNLVINCKCRYTYVSRIFGRKVMSKKFFYCVLVILFAISSGCGNVGELYLPEETNTPYVSIKTTEQ